MLNDAGVRAAFARKNVALVRADWTRRDPTITRALAALTSLRVEAWPFAGPIGIRERGDIHIIHDWRYLGTARNEADIDEILQTRASDFDEHVYMLLAQKLPRLAPHQIIRFPDHIKRRRSNDFELA